MGEFTYYCQICSKRMNGIIFSEKMKYVNWHQFFWFDTPYPVGVPDTATLDGNGSSGTLVVCQKCLLSVKKEYCTESPHERPEGWDKCLKKEWVHPNGTKIKKGKRLHYGECDRCDKLAFLYKVEFDKGDPVSGNAFKHKYDVRFFCKECLGRMVKSFRHRIFLAPMQW